MLQPSSSVSSSSSSLLMELLKTCLCHVRSLLFALCNWLYTDKISLYISKTSSSTSWWCFDYKIYLNRSKTSSSTSWWCFDVWSLAALPSPCRKFASPQIPLDYSSPFTPLWWGCKHANSNQTNTTKPSLPNKKYQTQPTKSNLCRKFASPQTPWLLFTFHTKPLGWGGWRWWSVCLFVTKNDHFLSARAESRRREAKCPQGLAGRRPALP